MHIAVVDDDERGRRAVARLLTAHAFQIRCYASALEFVASVEDGRPSCLIVDLEMPGMSGLQLLHHLAGSGLGIPTIVMTGHDKLSLRHRCELAGAQFFLSKPVTPETLLNAIISVFEQDRTINRVIDA
jgi:FixJ family two-component response regulator